MADTNYLISMPSTPFTAPRSFKAVANGKIFIGEIDTDPVNKDNQIPVYIVREDGKEVQVPQPLIINAGGFPVYNGQIAKFITKKSHSIAVYDSANSQQYYWPDLSRFDPDSLRNDLASHDGSNSIGLPGSGQTLHDWISGEVRSLFYYLLPNKIASVISGIPTDITSELQMAMEDNITIFVPKGNYFTTESIVTRRDSGLIGAGSKHTIIDNRAFGHHFLIGDGGFSRGYRAWRDFMLDSSTGSAKNYYAFYYTDRQAADGEPVYTCGQVYSRIEINSWDRIGGGWYIQESFRAVIRDCGATGLSHPFRLVGSVVQLTINNFINNGGATPMAGRDYTYGLTTEIKTYSKGKVYTPEGVSVSATRFVKQDIGVRIAGGLLLVFDNVEADYSKVKGFEYRGGNQVAWNDCYVGVDTNRPNDFIGFDIPASVDGLPEAINVSGGTVNMSVNKAPNAASYTSYGARVGDSEIGTQGNLVEKVFFSGSGYTAGIYVKKAKTLSLNYNRFRFTGKHIVVDECPNLTMIGNAGEVMVSTS
ncbi:hypothetical protein RVB1_13060 [Escherichia coli]|uniref:phage tailspike protein n=1 Tax=Escherichia coli TaxID=562 RepID=UPI0016814ADA|nr:phage tailspike protein [Escherichia coli]BCL02654.1 hypothetical protein RVB1_13060 [Escherichia coli]